MISRRKFLAATAASASFPAILRAADKPALHLGLVADPQYADIEPIATRYYRQSIGKLTEAVDHFNSLDLDFCVNVGDTIDQQWQSFDSILKPLEKSKHKFHHILGNHDFDLPDDQKPKSPARLGMPAKYYTFNRGEFCFVFLDTNDISLYAYSLKSKEALQAYALLQEYAATGVIHAQPWNGAVGPTQMKWFEDTSKRAAEAKQKVIVFAHHPIYPFPHNHNCWNSDALLQLINRNRNIVAWINGHNHQGNFAMRDGVPFINLKGMVETPNTNAYATMQLFSDHLAITGKGREPSREVPFRTA